MLQSNNVFVLLVFIMKMDSVSLNVQIDNILIKCNRNVFLIVNSLLKFGKTLNANVLMDFIGIKRLEYVIQVVDLLKLELKEFANALLDIIKESMDHAFQFLVHLGQNGIKKGDNVIPYVKVKMK